VKKVIYKILLVILPVVSTGQSLPKKEINNQAHTWLSLNTLTKFSDRWAVMADVHLRTNDFFKDNNFTLIRTGISYIPSSKFSFNVGYSHVWLAPRNLSWTTYSDEKRIHEQVQLSTKQGNVSILQRIRNEQRWQEIIVDNKETGKNRFSNRVRYLISTTIPVFKSKKAPSLVLADEIMINFGRDVLYNTFDQNRLFIGFKKTINPKLSFDFGYMNVYQQRINGFQYDSNHTLRLFFYMSSSIVHAD
jgi:hypothetical protein